MASNKPPGEIRPGVIYTLSELRMRCGLGTYAIREARAAGLKVRRMGRKLFVFGDDFIAFVKRGDTAQQSD